MEVEGVKIQFLGHSGFLIENSSGKKIAIDPYHVSDKAGKADIILISHSHYDHCSIEDIIKMSKQGTMILLPADAQSKVTKVENIAMQIVEPGDRLNLGDIKIETLSAYNINKEFHAKSEGWMGFVIKIGNVIIYHAGDSDVIPEIKKLSGYGKKENKFIILMPVSGKYVMNAEEAAETASLLNPFIAIPMHYGAGVAGTKADAERFIELCKENNVRAELLEKI